jgi:LPPG:FO 2-phospho-L-lactate transferase
MNPNPAMSTPAPADGALRPLFARAPEGALRRVFFLSGGVGGARLLHGVAQAVPGELLTVIVNTGDDFTHWGMQICPDLDTVMYTLAELADEARGWGLRDETFHTLERMKALGADAWFALGDRDMATHLLRTEAMNAGETLTQITARLFERHGVRPRVLPMCDAPRSTWLDTFELGELPFQRWLVEHRAPRVRAVQLRGETRASPAVLSALSDADLILIGPSNPYVSIDPMVSLSGVRELLAQKCVVALSPIVGGRAVKGPLAEMIPTLGGHPPSANAIVEHYRGLLTGIVVEHGDEQAVTSIPSYATSTVMGGKSDRLRLAREVLEFAERLRGNTPLASERAP